MKTKNYFTTVLKEKIKTEHILIIMIIVMYSFYYSYEVGKMLYNYLN